ncbi:unnamed protein product [Prunus armeniaca]
MGCRSVIPHPSQTRRLSGLPFYSPSFSRFPQEALTTSFPVRSNQQAFHKVVTCCTASVSASDYAFTWDDVVKISKPVYISGATRKRSKSAMTLSLESHSEFLPFEVHSQRKIQTLMAVAFIAEHRTRAVGDVIKSLGEEHSPGLHMNGYVEKDGKKFLWMFDHLVAGGLVCNELSSHFKAFYFLFHQYLGCQCSVGACLNSLLLVSIASGP